MKKSVVFLLMFVLGFLFVNAQWYSNTRILPIVKKAKDNIRFEVNSLKQSTVFFIHYRTKGVEGFQVRKMKTDKDGNIYYRLSTKNLYGNKLEYYITQSGSMKSKDMTPVFTVTNFTKLGSPLIYFMQATSGNMSAKKSREHIVKLTASLSTNSRLSDNSQYPGKKYTANGNFRVYRNIYKSKYQFDFDSNFSYMNEPSEGEKKINLSNMMVRYKRGIHKIEAGDISVSASEFTASYLTRRGFSYTLDNQKFYFNTFYTNSQQKKGFDGFGIPASGANIFGAIIGYKIGYKFDIKGMFMSGVDNLDSKTISYGSGNDKFRNGSVMSLWSSLNLFNSKLTLKGEYAKSNFGKGATEESIEKISDTAFNTQMNFNYKIFSGNLSYKKVGSHFNSIANLFLQNDREGVNGGLTMTIKQFTLSITYIDNTTYMENNTLQPTLRTKDLTTTLSWMLGNHIKIGADYGTNNLDYDESTGLQTGSEDMNTIKYGSSLSLIAGMNSINLRVGKTESETFKSTLSGSVGLSISLGKFFTFYPSINYQETENFMDNSTSKMTSGYFSSEISFIPQIFTLSFTGSYSDSKNPYGNSKNISAGGNINFYMAKIFKNVIQPTISLKTKFQQSEYSGTKTDSFAIYLQADIAF